MNTENLIERLEAYRKGNRITRAEMSRIIGANSPNQYTNWVVRGSLPKAYYDAALRVLGHSADLTKRQIEFLERFDTLNEDQREIVTRLVDSLLATDPED